MVNLMKRSPLDLRKDARAAITTKPQLAGLQADVVLVMDRSGSMGNLYANGWVQNCAERVAALGAEFDADGKIDVEKFKGLLKKSGKTLPKTCPVKF